MTRIQIRRLLLSQTQIPRWQMLYLQILVLTEMWLWLPMLRILLTHIVLKELAIICAGRHVPLEGSMLSSSFLLEGFHGFTPRSPGGPQHLN